MPGITLYGSQLFQKSYASTVIRHLNNAPGRSHAGYGGVDQDVSGRIGYKHMRTGARVAGSNKGRIQGICCGITAGWVVAFLGGNSDAVDHDTFQTFFVTNLRFQGAYVKDHKPNSDSIKLLLEGFGLKNSNPTNSVTEMTPESIESKMPGDTFWAGYISAYKHAVGIGYKNYRYFIMEPNGGLFEYQNKAHFINDLKAFLLARANGADDPSMKVYFYEG